MPVACIHVCCCSTGWQGRSQQRPCWTCQTTACWQCCSSAQMTICTLFSAARSHSRLHQAAAAALDSIYATLKQQQRVDGVLYYLSLHGQHIDGLDLEGKEDCSISLFELPGSLQLTSSMGSCCSCSQGVPSKACLGLLQGWQHSKPSASATASYQGAGQ